MSSEPDIKNEVGTDNTNEEATEPPPETKIEAILEEPIKNEVKTEVKTEEVANEADFKNKADRLKNKKVNCKDCGANLTLKTLRYSHKCSKTEDKEVKPKPRKAKPKAISIQPPINNEVITNEEPVYMNQVKQQVRAPDPPPVIKTPQEIINENFMLIQQQYINQRREKANNLVQSMFSGGLRNKRR